MIDTLHSPIRPDQLAVYRVEVRGSIGLDWAAWFEGAAIAQRGPMISIEALVDQAALRGLLCRLWDLNLSVMSVARLDVNTPATGGTSNEHPHQDL
jgi:hypothetical protein